MANQKKNANLNPDADGRLAYRFSEASELIGIPVSTLQRMARRGDINPVTSFGTWLITAEELEAILAERLRNTGD